MGPLRTGCEPSGVRWVCPNLSGPLLNREWGLNVDVVLKHEILDKLSHRGIMAYVAVTLAGVVDASTSTLAGLVRVQPAVMLEGLKELAVAEYGTVRPGKKGRWLCGPAVNGAGVASTTGTERYAVFIDDLKGYWDYLNPGLPFAMGGADGAAIRRWLADHPNWERQHWRRALWNRSQSVVVKSAPFFTWIPKLSEHAAESLNEYNKPQEGTGKKGVAINVEEANRSAREHVLSKSNGRG